MAPGGSTRQRLTESEQRSCWQAVVVQTTGSLDGADSNAIGHTLPPDSLHSSLLTWEGGRTATTRIDCRGCSRV